MDGNEPIYNEDININKTIQRWLNLYAACNLRVDGFLGPKTQQGLVKALQHTLNCEHGGDLELNGILNSDTIKVCLRVTIGLKAMGNEVSLLQALLYANGINPNGFNGTYDEALQKAVRYFQSINGLPNTGICDSNVLIMLADFMNERE